MPYRLGIDLGTTFTAAAICRPTGNSELVCLGTRASSVPSVLFLDQDTTLVGEAAERRALTDPGRVVREFKRRIGDDTPIVVGGQPHQAHDLAARLVRWVVDRVTEREGEPPDAIAVTHPASWGPHRVALLRAALSSAGVDDVLLLTEPQAAALQYSLAERIEPGRTIAVYDLGGGTFDAAVVRKTATGDFELLGPPEGIERLGGIDFDEEILDRVLAELPPMADDADPVRCSAMARLRRECTEAKEALSNDTEATIPVLLPETRTQVRLARSEFEDLVRPILAATVRSLQRAVRSAGLRGEELTAVLLVGGSSRIPLVTQMISAELGRPVALDADPKGVVALGAAMAAHRSVTPLESTTDVVVPAPRRPDHDCIPPALTRPRQRLRRTKIVMVTLGMLILALAVIPSPFTSDSDTPAGKGGQPARADVNSGSNPNNPAPAADKRKRDGHADPVRSDRADLTTGDASPGKPGEQAPARGPEPQPAAGPVLDPRADAASVDPTPTETAGTTETTADPPSGNDVTLAEVPPPPESTVEPPPATTEEPPPLPAEPDPPQADPPVTDPTSP